MSLARKSRRSSTRACNQDASEDDGGSSSSSSSQGSPGEGADTKGFVGRVVAQYRGKTLLRGVVGKYNTPTAGNDESWTVSYNDELEEVGRPGLESQLSLHTTGWESPPGSGKRGRGRPRKPKTGPAKRRPTASLKPVSAKKQRSATSSSLVAKTRKEKGKGKAGSSGSVELGGTPYIGKRIAKHFSGWGVFTGEIMEVKTKSTKGTTLFNVMFEDGDEEDYEEGEIEEHMKLYDNVSNSFAVAPREDEATESGDDDGTTTPKRKGKAKGKGKGKGKETRGGGASVTHVGARVRVFFPDPDDYFNGTVTGHLAPEDDDAYGDLYHVTYDDGDEEDLDFMQLEEAITVYNYNKRYPLVRKKVSISTSTKKNKKVALFGENTAGSPVFATVQGYHDDGRFKKIS